MGKYALFKPTVSSEWRVRRDEGSVHTSCLPRHLSLVTRYSSRFLPIVDAHYPAEQVNYAYLRQSQFAHFCRHLLLPRVMLQRFEDITIGARITAKESPQQWDEQPKISEVTTPPKRVARLAELQRNDSPTRGRHALHLAQ